jgi:hypothetical protein
MKQKRCRGFGALKTEGIGLVRALRVHRPRCHSFGFLEPDPGIELA